MFFHLQGLTTFNSEKSAQLLGLIDTYCLMSGMSGPHVEDEIAAVYTSTAEVHGRYVLTHSDSKLFIEILCMWVLAAVKELEEADMQHVFVSVSKLFVETASRISEIVLKCDASNEATTELQPVLPHQLVHLNMRRFVSCVNRNL